MLKEAETAGDGTAAEVYSVLKKYEGADSLNQQMVEELVEKVLVTDPEHVEIVWKFSDEVLKLIED